MNRLIQKAETTEATLYQLKLNQNATRASKAGQVNSLQKMIKALSNLIPDNTQLLITDLTIILMIKFTFPLSRILILTMSQNHFNTETLNLLASRAP